MAVDGYFPHFTHTNGEVDERRGDGLVLLIDGKCLLFDGFQGGEPTNRIKNWLASRGVFVIDLCIISHPHWDHYQGPLEIADDGRFTITEMRCYHPETLRFIVDDSDNGQAVADDIYNMYTVIRHLQSKGTLVHFIDHGATFTTGGVTWKVYREQPRHFTEDDKGNGWAFVNNGSLCLYSPEIEILYPGDGPEDQETMINHFGGEISGTAITHHGGSWVQHNAIALKRSGCVVAWESCIEKTGPGTTKWTRFGSRRIREQGIPVLMQDKDLYIHAENGLITFTQGDKVFTKKVSYQGSQLNQGWGKDEKGWYYILADGTKAVGWSIRKWSGGSHWFYFDENGYMVTGWQKLMWSKGENWFYFDPVNGNMKVGWIFSGKCWYYLEPDTGAMRTGWLQWNGKWCYLEPSETNNQGHCYVSCSVTIDGKLYSFDKDGYMIESKKELNGCDVASYQSSIEPADMTTTDFFIVKFTQGTWYTNPYAEIQYNKAKQAGKLLGAYHYAEGGDPLAEARYFVNKLGSKGNKIGECLLALDWEGQSNRKFNTSEEVAWVRAFANEVHLRTGVWPYIYMSKGVTRRRSWGIVAENSPLWCAQYPNSNATNYQESPWTDSNGFGAWGKDTIRQYSSHGRVRGYGKNLDINKAFMSVDDWIAASKGDAEIEKPSIIVPTKTEWSEYVTKTTNPVKISNSGSDERGNYKGGTAGDQNGREWYIRDWYNRPWNCVLRHPLAEVRACIATLAVKAAENDKIGYDQNQRNSYGEELAKVGYDPSKIAKAVESDCSKGVIDNAKATGYILGIPELQRIEATYTGNMRKGFQDAGFIVLTESMYLTGDDYLLAGDILLNDAHHTATVVTNGTKSGETIVMPLVKRGSIGSAVVQLQKMLNAVNYRQKKRLTEDGEFGPSTQAQVIFYQVDRKLTPDGEVGPNTWGQLYEDVY